MSTARTEVACAESAVRAIRLTEASLDRHLRDMGEHRDLGALLLSSGAVEGPFRALRPITLNWRQRLTRWARGRRINTDAPRIAALDR